LQALLHYPHRRRPLSNYIWWGITGVNTEIPQGGRRLCGIRLEHLIRIWKKINILAYFFREEVFPLSY